MSMTEVRKRPGDFFNSVTRDRPAFISRHNDMIMAFSKTQIFEFVKNLTLSLNIDFNKEDGIYVVDVPELDLFAWGEDLEAVKLELAQDALDYAKHYLESFNLYFNAPNRKSHFPHIMRILLCENKEQVLKELLHA